MATTFIKANSHRIVAGVLQEEALLEIAAGELTTSDNVVPEFVLGTFVSPYSSIVYGTIDSSEQEGMPPDNSSAVVMTITGSVGLG